MFDPNTRPNPTPNPEIIGRYPDEDAAQQKMHQTAFGVLLVVFFVGFSCGAVVFNGLCGGW